MREDVINRLGVGRVNKCALKKEDEGVILGIRLSHSTASKHITSAKSLNLSGQYLFTQEDRNCFFHLYIPITQHIAWQIPSNARAHKSSQVTFALEMNDFVHRMTLNAFSALAFNGSKRIWRAPVLLRYLHICEKRRPGSQEQNDNS